MLARKKLLIVLAVLFFITIIVLSGVIAYLLLTDDDRTSEESSDTYSIKVVDGQIVEVDNGVETTIFDDADILLAKKAVFGEDTDEDLGDIDEDAELATYIESASLSPDQQKVCFVLHTITPKYVFYLDLNQNNQPYMVGTGKNCFWSHDSTKFAYNNHTTDVSPVNVLVFNTETFTLTNLTSSVQSENIIRSYREPSWSNDDSTITAVYGGLNFDNPNSPVAGTSIITLATGEITDN